MSSQAFRHFKKYLRAYTVGAIGLLASLALFYALQAQEERHIRSIAELGIETITNDILAEFSFDSHVLQHIATIDIIKESHIQDILDAYPRFYAMAELDSNFQVHAFANEKPGLVDKALFLGFIHENIDKLRKFNELWTSSPVRLSDKKLAFFLIYPYQSHYLIALIDSAALFYHSTQVPGMFFDVYLNQQLISPPKPDKASPLLDVSKDLYGARWDIKAREKTSLHFMNLQAPLSWLTLFLGISISLLLARSLALSRLLEEQTVILNRINQDLKLEITEHLQTEESKKNLEKALLQGQKLQAIGTLAGGIAHDFNNILYAIRGYAELAREDIPKEGITYKNLGKILEGTHRGQDLVARILRFSRRQHHELSPLLLKTEIAGALSLLRPTIPESVELRFEASTEGRIMGNKTQIHQVMVNLINNAVDAMDSEGIITITLSHVPAKDMLRSENYCKIEVSDTGHGMDPSIAERIFEPFFTTKEVGKGTGLGLSTVHTIVKEHHGEIVVNSQQGKGTSFTVFFPEFQGPQEGTKHG